ncbi:MAG: hypothetical protein AMXMBFR82_51790 [Candidatus Hydrogenedentota bacterium]
MRTIVPLVLLSTFAFIPASANADPEPVALWEFDTANPLKAAIGADLTLQGDHQPVAGVNEADGACTIGDGSFYKAQHGIAVQPGQKRVNAYTFVVDFKTPVDTDSHALFQTNLANDDDNDMETLNREGVLGAGFVGFSSQWAFTPGEWHRLIVCADLPSGRYDVYLNGKHAIHGAPQDLDRRYSLDPEGVLFFADDEGDDAEVTVSRIAIYDHALSAKEVMSIAYLTPPDPKNTASAFEGNVAEIAVKTGEPVSFTIPVSDPEGDRIRYRLYAGSWKALTPWSELQSSDEPISASHVFHAAGRYPVSIEIRDEYGAETSPQLCATVEVSGDPSAEFVTPPYLMSVAQDGITIMWEANDALNGTVQIDGKPHSATCEPSGFGTYIYKTELTGLKPGTDYTATVDLTQDGLSDFDLTQSVQFTTSPAEADPFTFSVWSDSQGHNRGAYEADIYEPTNRMFDHMVAQDVAFGVACGDMAEDGGAYEDTRNYFLNRVSVHLGAHKPFFVAWGNHDDYRDAALRKFASFPKRDVPGYTNSYGSYSFDYSGCHFVCIDYATQWPDIFHWVEQDLKAHQDAKFTFFFIHEPPYCELWIDGESTMRAQLVPLLERYSVDAVFSGHTHEYERGYRNGVYYCITGGASWLDHGEPVVKDWPHMTVGGAQDIPGFKNGLVNEYVRVSVGEDSWKAEAIGFTADGTEIGVIDTFSSDDPPAKDERADQPVVHTVLFWLSHELTDEQVAALIDGLETLRAIDGVEALHYGRPLAANRPIEDDSYAFGVTLVFRDEAALESYLPDPVHQAFVKEFSPYWIRAQVYDFRQE